MDVASFHAQNPNGIAMTYVRSDLPAACYPFHESSINVSYQESSNTDTNWYGSCTTSMIAPHTVFNWPGGTDNRTDGPAANVGFMRAWNNSHDNNGSMPGCRPNTACTAFALQNADTADLVSRLMLHAAKKDQIYAKGWDGIWSDNAVCANSSKSFCDGLNMAYSNLRRWLPGKFVGGNGTWEVRNMPGYPGNCCGGWLGSDPDGFKKMANANLIEGLGYYGTDPDLFINWNTKVLSYPDPYGMPRYNAFWDWGGANTHQRVRWGLTLSMMAGVYYQAPNAGWYDEYWGGSLNQRGYLGQATGPAVKLSNGVWRRDFEKGMALNNSTGSLQTVSLGSTFRHLAGTQAPTLNSGSLVSLVTVPNQDGLILLR
jgi:hypothetical protein